MNSNIPVDLTRLTGLMCVSAPERKTNLDGDPRKDREGNQLWVTGLSVRRNGTRKASVIDVQTAAEPVGVTEGTLVALTEPEVSLWEIEGRHGLSWRAASIYAATARASGDTPAVTSSGRTKQANT
ncbi:hypothetical protein [Paractinoplanes brasiliensis]|uniref:Uncharacterized protein n=1 Tax=Paractinoplanes brasiliensis TaxID=52695 RepID=A0A4R6JS40_9ACTN|nr:hypothetical protein [Actinoplanes brasiliensis]TDO38231.1 hypothetical protein C8E87_1881 [Actinoplanes brasiliensis]GID26992.1 hypothetical protein Abr02nite_19750 [Actinoplanes brasiliensis]